MSTLFSAISGQFGRAFMIAAILPAMLFVFAVQLLVAPMLPWQGLLLKQVEWLDPEWKLVVFGAAVIAIGGLLHSLNIPIIRFYEGYPWRDGAIGKWMTARHRRRLAAAISARASAREMRLQLDAGADKALIERLQLIQNSMASSVFDDFPLEPSVLPTRLGNTIRSFENYPRRQYGIWAITLYPRFVAKIPNEFAAVIDDAKTMFNVVLHLSFLAFLFSGLTITAGCFYPPVSMSRWLVSAGAGLAMGSMFYVVSIGRAGEWGTLVRAAFDLYRWDVLRDLGFSQKPATMAGERELWNDISRQLAYGDSLQPSTVTYAAMTAALPRMQQLRITRGISRPGAQRTVRIRVHNAGTDRVSGVSVVEHLPPGHDYVWASAKRDGNAVEVVGTNPYSFVIGDLPPAQAVEISFDVVDSSVPISPPAQAGGP